MELFKAARFLTVYLLSVSSCLAVEDLSLEKKHALYLMHIAHVDEAITKYQEIVKTSGPDFEILRQLGFSLMKQGAKKDPESRLLAVFGSGMAGSSASLEILEEGLSSEEPQTQLAALFFIAQINDDYSDELLLRAMGSEFLSTRLEACFHMAAKKHPYAIGHIEALMYRLPPFFKPFFPQLFALIGNNEAMGPLRRFLSDPAVAVRIETIHSLVQFGRDDFIPLIRKRLTHSSNAEQEACAFALGALRDSSAELELKKISRASGENTKLAALKSLYQLGHVSAGLEIEQMAKERNLFAIASLGGIPGAEDTLAELLYDKNIQVRINAALCLLQRRDRRCLPALKEIFIGDPRDLAIQPHHSLGKAHQSIQVVSSAYQHSKDPLFDPAISLALRENFLTLALHLEELDFLQIARMIVDAKQNDLIPHLIKLLENLQTEQSIAFLRAQTQKAGAPLIRDYCNLALFRLKEEGPYEENLIKWIMRQKNEELIRLRPMLGLKSRQEVSQYSLSAEETSQLLIDSYLALASRQDQKSIDLVLKALKEGNEKNRYVLAGLLIKATE